MNDSPELPVAAKVRRQLPESSEWFITYTSYGDSNFDAEKRNPDELVRKVDAEEAIQKARQAERKEILDKWRELDNKIHCGIDTYEAWNKLKEELRDDLQESDNQ